MLKPLENSLLAPARIALPCSRLLAPARVDFGLLAPSSSRTARACPARPWEPNAKGETRVDGSGRQEERVELGEGGNGRGNGKGRRERGQVEKANVIGSEWAIGAIGALGITTLDPPPERQAGQGESSGASGKPANSPILIPSPVARCRFSANERLPRSPGYRIDDRNPGKPPSLPVGPSGPPSLAP